MTIVIINHTAHLSLDRQGNTLELCPEEALEEMTMGEFAKMVQNQMAVYYYNRITGGRNQRVH